MELEACSEPQADTKIRVGEANWHQRVLHQSNPNSGWIVYLLYIDSLFGGKSVISIALSGQNLRLSVNPDREECSKLKIERERKQESNMAQMRSN